jgi:hypothetical protein
MEVSLAFLVRDYRRGEFGSWEEIKQMEDLKLAVEDLPYYVRRAKAEFSGAELEVVDSPRVFLTAEEGEFDAMLYSAEAGSAWTLLRPEFSVVIPKPGVVSIPVVFGLPSDEPTFNQFIDTWVDLNKSNGNIDQLYDYWILGRGTQAKKRRWSVAHDVWGWGSDDEDKTVEKDKQNE